MASLRGAALLLVGAAVVSPLPAGAQEPPACTSESVGTVACIAGRLCSCGFERGGTMTGLGDGFRWDCGILRPQCPQDRNRSATRPGDGSWPLGDIDVDVLAPARPRWR